MKLRMIRKKLSTCWIKSLVLTVMYLLNIAANGQVENFEISVRNLTQTAVNKLEFDVFLLDTDPDQSFELSSCQLGFLFNSYIYSGGSVTVEIDNTDTGLNLFQQFAAEPTTQSSLTGYPDQTLIRLASGFPVSPGGGTIISTVTPGTLLTHFIISATVSFTSNTNPNIVFNSNIATSPLYPTRVAEFIALETTQLAVNPGVNAIVIGNPVLNPPPPIPASYAVTGGGAYCEGTGGLPVGIASSETGVSYTLFKDGSPQVQTIDGTGSSITFDDQLTGTYTVSGTNVSGTTAMTGTAVLIENPLPAIPVANAGSNPAISQITANWSASSDATAYILDVSEEDNFISFVAGYQDLNVGNVTTFDVTGLSAGTTYYYRIRSENSCGISASSATISCSTSVATGLENSELAGFSLYPNPAKDYIIISIEDYYGKQEYSIKILDMHGKNVLEMKVAQPIHEINLSGMPGKGLYTVQVYHKGNVIRATRKFILQ